MKGPLRLTPPAITEFLVAQKNLGGGPGDNFSVERADEEQVDQPVIEAVMVAI